MSAMHTRRVPRPRAPDARTGAAARAPPRAAPAPRSASGHAHGPARTPAAAPAPQHRALPRALSPRAREESPARPRGPGSARRFMCTENERYSACHTAPPSLFDRARGFDTTVRDSFSTHAGQRAPTCGTVRAASRLTPRLGCGGRGRPLPRRRGYPRPPPRGCTARPCPRRRRSR